MIYAVYFITQPNPFQCMSSVAKVESLLPTDTFIVVMKGLMGNHLPSVRRKALELLNNKLQHKTKWEESQVHTLTHSRTNK